MLASGDIFAGYVIDRQLGRGGMGSVYLAKHPRLPRMTALKLLNQELFYDKEVRARFEREADLVAQLDHPNIVTVYDRGLDDEQLWISMQYVDGIDAASVDPTALPPERAVQIVRETAGALDYAHHRGVLHRDVKPANIMLARGGSGRGERVYLTDFGIARLRNDSGHLTQTGTFTATVAYASPEQLSGTELDHRSDQYSLACTLHWLLTGKGPFPGNNPAAVIQGHLQGTPPSLAAARPGLPFALDGVLAKAMAKNPNDRFGSCAEFAAAAHHALTGQSAPALPVVGSTGPPTPLAGAPQATPTMLRPGTTGAPQPTMGHGYATPPPGTAPPRQFTAGPNPYGPHPHPQYNAPPQPGPYGPPSRNSVSGSKVLLIVAIVVVAVLVAIVSAVIKVQRIESNSNSMPATPTYTAPATLDASEPVTADTAALSAAFPGMLPATSSGEIGYHGATCYTMSPGTKPNPDQGEPDFGSYAAQWRCYKGNNNDDPYYRFYAYDSTIQAQAILNSLSSKASPATATAGGKSVTNYSYMDDGAKMVTAFTGDPQRAQFLMYTDAFTADSTDELLSWWRSAPL